MALFDQILLSQIRLLAEWRNAKKGALLQMWIDESLEMGVRCNFKAINGTREGLLILLGSNAGKLVIDGYLQGSALDVSELVEIVAVNPCTIPPHSELLPGALYEHTGSYYVWFNMWKGSGNGFIRLTDGENFMTLPAADRIAVAPRTSFILKEKSN